MQRNYQISEFATINFRELNKRTAYHEAGHAVAIYLYNKHKKLPPVYFQVHLKNHHAVVKQNASLSLGNIFARIEGGHLVQDLIFSTIDIENYLTLHERVDYYAALEADIVNLLAGAIAEAHYVSLADNEVINPHLLNVAALKNYGGQSDLQKIQEYLTCFSKNPAAQNQKLTHLLHTSFNFITRPKNWQAVKAVAQFILTCNKPAISCEEIATLIDKVHA
jgi:hypothetical protein